MKQRYTLTEIDSIAQVVIQHWQDPILLLDAPMGAGKTTLIKALCKQLGVQDVVSSPTFSLVNTYLDAADQPIYHFDLYRLERFEEALDIGVDTYLDSGYRCCIEWPKLIQSLLPNQYQKLSITILSEKERQIELT